MRHPEVLVFGELLWDLLPSGKVLGGAPANFALRLHERGIPARIATAVGCDALGDEAAAMLSRRGLDLSLLQRCAAAPTGTVDVALSAGGDPSFTIRPGTAYDHIAAAPALLQAAERCDLIYFGTLVQRSPVSRATLYSLLNAAPQALRFADVNLRRDCFSAETVELSFRQADVVKLNDSEMQTASQLLGLKPGAAADFAAQVIRRYGLRTCLVTLGERGVYAADCSGAQFEIPALKVKVADLVGTGDAFSAGFAAKLLAGAPLEECCRFGNLLGALAASKTGGMAPITEPEIDNPFSHA